MNSKAQLIKNKRCKRSLGFTLLELLIATAMTVVLSGAIAFAYADAMNIQRLDIQQKSTQDRTMAMEREITEAIEGAQLSSTTTDTTSYFQGLDDAGGSDLGCDRITVSTTYPGVPIGSIYSIDDFLTQQTSVGPVGGLSEISFGVNPVGTPGAHTGLFERTQRPSDSDPTQGGYEMDLDPDVTEMGFQFWDGVEWDTQWDTTTGTRRLPQAVQVEYRLKGDTGKIPHMFVVIVLSSDCNVNNPVSTAGIT
jgi:type II secretory pathway pseudopilin PulG